tara:strand:- start:94 stop:972 length:879 start_codon:yes stop_codon:yes gene_type:complete
MKKIIWVASYPKSGNTWLRAILSSLFFTKDGIFNFKLFGKIINFDNPSMYEYLKLSNREDHNNLHEISVICKYWVEAQNKLNIKDGDFTFFKTHSGNVKVDNNQYTNSENTLGVIYVVRDPRDVVISYSKHNRVSIDRTINDIISKNCITRTALPKKNPYPILMSSWDIHYKTWKNIDVPKLLIKYENLLSDTNNIIQEIIKFFNKYYNIDFPNLEQKINNIIETTNFDSLKKHEKKYGFNEAPYLYFKTGIAEYFFREGKSGQWKNILTKDQIKKIENEFKETMIELGYLE